MAVKRSREKVLTRAQAVVPVAATGPFLPTTDDTEGGAIGVFLVDEDGVPYSAGGGTITVEAEATAAAPTYVEGTANPLSMDLSGALRVTGTINASSSATATAAAPTYVEGTDNPLSQNLSGDLRVIAKPSGTFTVSGTVAATQSGTWNIGSITTLPALATGANVIGGVTQSGTWNITNVSGTISLPTGASTAALQGVQGTGATYNPPAGGSGEIGYLSGIYAAAIDTTPATVIGATAADAALTNAPVTTGGLAKTANPTAVADGDVVNTLHDKLGKVIAVSAVRDLKGVQHTTITASTSETTIVTAVASTFNDLYGLIIANSSATATEVTIKDATGGTTRATIAVPANASAGFMLDPGGAIPQATVNNNWTATAADSVTSLFITALYVKNT